MQDVDHSLVLTVVVPQEHQFNQILLFLKVC